MNGHVGYPDALPPGGSTPAERLVVAGEWLLKAAPSREKAVAEWSGKAEAAWLRCGWLFAAVVMRFDVVHAAIEQDGPVACAGPLIKALGGPVIYNPGWRGRATYTALVSAHVQALWNVPGTSLYPESTMLLVPSPERSEPRDRGPWWVSPPTQAGLLCAPIRVFELAAVGWERRVARALRGCDA